jgi:hypothetical protein
VEIPLEIEGTASSTLGVSSRAPAKPAAASTVRNARLGFLSWVQPEPFDG